MAEQHSTPESGSDRAVVGLSRDRRRKSGLGRGLGALIPEMSTADAGASIDEIDISLVRPNPYQPRSDFEDEAFQELVASIALHGVLQPIIVRPDPAGSDLVLIAGERRWRAAEAAGLETIPALIKDVTPQQMLELALVENVVRADLTALEEAIAYRQLIEEFGLTQSEVAERVGRSRVSVTNTLRLLFAPDAVKHALQRGEISEGHARALLSLPSPADQISMLESIIAREMTVRQTEEAVRGWLNRTTRDTTAKSQTRSLSGERTDLASNRLQRSLATKVTVKATPAGRGTIQVHFDSVEQLEDLVARIAGENLF